MCITSVLHKLCLCRSRIRARRIVVKDVMPIKTPPLIVRVSHISQQPLDQVNTGKSHGTRCAGARLRQSTIRCTPDRIRGAHHIADMVKAMSNEILATLRDIIRVNPLFQQVSIAV